MIDREDAVTYFYQLLESAAPFRILRLLGEAKMGKTHLLTKVFRILAEQYAVRCAVLDLRNPQQDILSHLHNARSQIGYSHFSAFDQAYADRIKPQQIQMKTIRAIFTIITIIARSPNRDTDTDQLLYLTRCFVDDLRRLKDQMVVLIFDQVDDATPATQMWLMNTLLVQLQELDHVRVVVGGRTVPDASGSYAMSCQSHELMPVREERAYIDYCREVGARLEEQSIRDFAEAFCYVPGAFAEIVLTRFVP
jgi:hypothetical protein